MKVKTEMKGGDNSARRRRAFSFAAAAVLLSSALAGCAAPPGESGFSAAQNAACPPRGAKPGAKGQRAQTAALAFQAGGYSKTGRASWYGAAFQGKKTASGEIFNMDNLTAAHRNMPLPSYARVTNLANGSSLIVRVNDRGPYAHNRIIDLSQRAAQLLGYRSGGTADVRVDYVGPAPLKTDDGAFLRASYSPAGAPAPVSPPETLAANAFAAQTAEQNAAEAVNDAAKPAERRVAPPPVPAAKPAAPAQAEISQAEPHKAVELSFVINDDGGGGQKARLMRALPFQNLPAEAQ